MAKYKETAKETGAFITVDYRKQVIPGTFEWTMSNIVDNEIDLAPFDAAYKNDETGASAIEPRILLKIIFYSYHKGVLSSRKMMALCRENMTMKALAEDTEPDFTTIAMFIRTKGELIKGIFKEVLMICDELKLIGGKVYAMDGCKLSSSASKEMSGTHDELEKKAARLEKIANNLIKRHKERDRKENGNEKSEAKKKEADTEKEKIKRLKRTAEKIRDFLDKNEKKLGSRGDEIQSNVTDNESAKIKGPHGVIQGYNGIAVADGKSQVIVACGAFGSGPEKDAFAPMPEETIENMKEVTGEEKPLEKALMLADTGYFCGENLMAAKEKEVEVIIPDQQFRKRDERFDGAVEDHGKKAKRYGKDDFEYDRKRDEYICPAGKALRYKCEITLNGKKGKQYAASVLDCRGCALREKCTWGSGGKRNNSHRTLFVMEETEEGKLVEEMKKKIDLEKNRKRYAQRMQIIEPVFADITYCKGMNRFTLRGQRKVNYQWMLYCIVHNIGKCRGRYGKRRWERVRKAG